jgi:hypothetical protein
MIPSLLNLFAVVLRPFRESLYGLPQGASQRGQLVFDPWRDGGKDGSSDEAVALKATERQGQHAPLVTDTIQYLSDGNARIMLVTE